ncbi:DUF2950 domain-containing protein [Sabulicella rubraurantiaca]|uniref:DUF2950 domain-containing protein n=1 Tax=Sabulicella rubraurantiaca TaxID=2811429 RepID=UPI001F3EBC19|nr:DUF2950 domain-containing protein [Sabulicella rubraurantiaca]
MSTMRVLLLAGTVSLALLPGPGATQTTETPTPVPPAGSGAAAAPSRPKPVQPQGFRTAEGGFAAMAEAARAHDEQRLLRILGEAARRLLRSGDPVEDRAARDRFADAYEERHEVVMHGRHVAFLDVGNDRWRLPIPMVRYNNFWWFDARHGSQELINRRIGRNELNTIQVLRAIVVAQDDYAREVGQRGALRAYARRFFSTPGTHDGLYWPSEEGQAESPLGPLLAAAAGTAAGAQRAAGDTAPRPFHGYLFRILESQGPDAPGGAAEFVVSGLMIGGFAVIAVPAQYGVTGIQTFQVSHAGVVYQRNLGPDTTRIASGITAFNPGPGWERVQE